MFQKKLYYCMAVVCVCLVIFSLRAGSNELDSGNPFANLIGGLSLDLCFNRYYQKSSPYGDASKPINIGRKTDPLEKIKKFDWRFHDKVNWVPPTKIQSDRGQSWVFAPVAMVESRMKIWAKDPNINIDLSEQYLLSSCRTFFQPPPPTGYSALTCVDPYFPEEWKTKKGFAIWALDEIRTSGIPAESCMEYGSTFGWQCWPAGKMFYQIQDWGFVDGDWRIGDKEKAVTAIKKELLNGPVCTYMECCPYFLEWLHNPRVSHEEEVWPTPFYEEKIKESPVLSKYDPSLTAGIYVTIIGWNDEGSDRYWIVRNSYPSWQSGNFVGDYFKIRMEENYFKIEEQVYFAIPKPYFKRVFSVKYPASIQEMIDAVYDIAVCGSGDFKYFLLGDEILVEKGTYPEIINFRGMPLTIRSNPKNGKKETILDGYGGGPVVTFKNKEGSNSVLKGFTIKNGSAENGGGIYCNDASPTIIDCNIVDNTADVNGGGVYYFMSDSAFSKNTEPWGISGKRIHKNVSYEIHGKELSYDGPYYYEACRIRLIKCEINDNTAAQKGGGIYSKSPYYEFYEFSNSPADLKKCKIKNNMAENGGGIWYYGYSHIDSCNIRYNDVSGDGGGLYFDSEEQNVLYCEITDNTADLSGGGAYCRVNEQRFIGCVIAKNTAQIGGGVYCNSIKCLVTNCTVTGNEAIENGGGIFADGHTIVYLTNSILWDNSRRDYDCMGREEGVIRRDEQYPLLRYVYSDIGIIGIGDTGGSQQCAWDTGIDGQTNISDIDPWFWCPEGDDYRLQPDSPCIDRGTPESYYPYPPMSNYSQAAETVLIVDPNSKKKPKDGNSDGTVRWDMGALEFDEPDLCCWEDANVCKVTRDSDIPPCKPQPCVQQYPYNYGPYYGSSYPNFGSFYGGFYSYSPNPFGFGMFPPGGFFPGNFPFLF